MNVKCRICGAKVDKCMAYCVVKNGRNMYYCSEKEYNEYIAHQTKITQQKIRLNQTIESFIGKTTNTILYKEISIWLSVADYDTICDYLIENKTNISAALNKEFTSEYSKIRYFSAIIKNSIGDYKPKQPEITKPVEAEIYEIKFKPRIRRKCLIDYEDGE